jgi:hypothetical protein
MSQLEYSTGLGTSQQTRRTWLAHGADPHCPEVEIDLPEPTLNEETKHVLAEGAVGI